MSERERAPMESEASEQPVLAAPEDGRTPPRVLFGPFSSLQSKVQDVTIEPYGLPDHSTALSFWGVLQARGA